MKAVLVIIMVLALSACRTNDVFMPASEYPPDPYVKGYADPEDCIGGERLAAITLDLPNYPSRAFRTGRQGWTLMRLDVAPDGTVSDASVERAVPEGLFERASTNAIMGWTFEPPGGDGLKNCRVLLRYRLGDVTLGG